MFRLVARANNVGKCCSQEIRFKAGQVFFSTDLGLVILTTVDES